MNKTNKTIVDMLKNNIEDGLTLKDELVEIHNLYGIFLDDNIFRVCRETTTKGKYCKVFELYDFFNDTLIKWTVEYKENNIDIPWRKVDEFGLFNGEKVIAMPLKTLLSKNSLKGVTTKKNIINLYKTINNILKDNPEFIDMMFLQIESSKQI